MERMKTQVELLKECCDIKDAACVKYQKRIAELEEENKKLKSDLEECECSMRFENDEVGYRKRECKKLKAELKKYKEQYQHSLGGDDEKGLYV